MKKFGNSDFFAIRVSQERTHEHYCRIGIDIGGDVAIDDDDVYLPSFFGCLDSQSLVLTNPSGLLAKNREYSAEIYQKLIKDGSDAQTESEEVFWLLDSVPSVCDQLFAFISVTKDNTRLVYRFWREDERALSEVRRIPNPCLSEIGLIMRDVARFIRSETSRQFRK